MKKTKGLPLELLWFSRWEVVKSGWRYKYMIKDKSMGW